MFSKHITKATYCEKVKVKLLYLCDDYEPSFATSTLRKTFNVDIENKKHSGYKKQKQTYIQIQRHSTKALACPHRQYTGDLKT